MTKLITSTMKLNHEKQWQKDNLEQKRIEHKGTITENDWKPKISNDTVIMVRTIAKCLTGKLHAVPD